MQARPFDIESDLVTKHGELMSGDDLWRALGYGSKRSFSRAVVSNTVPLLIFELANRRGRFARTRDVARWLASLGKSDT